MAFPDSPSTTGWLLAGDFVFNGNLVPGGAIFPDRVLAQQLYAAGAPIINYEPQQPGDPNPDPFLQVLKAYEAMRSRDPSVQFMPFLAPLIKDGFDSIFRILQYRVGWFNGVGPWNPQAQWGGNQVFDDPNPLALLMPEVPAPTPNGDYPIGGRVQFYRPKPSSPALTLQDVAGRPIGLDFASAAPTFDATGYLYLEAVLLQDPTQPWPTAWWFITDART